MTWARLFKDGLRPRVSVKFEFEYKKLKRKLRLIYFVYNLVIAAWKE